MKAAGSDAESDDVLAAVAAVVARDKQVQAELAGEARKRFARYASSDSEDETATAGPAGRRRSGGAAANGGGLAADVARVAGSSDEEGEDGPAGVVEFGGGDGGTAERRAAKRRKREGAAAAASAAGAAGSKRPKSAAVSVRPGELVHAGAMSGGRTASGGAQAGEGGFAALGLPQQLADHLAAQGFGAPTGVQQESIPVLLNRRDALINAPTGSGKTLRWVQLLCLVVGAALGDAFGFAGLVTVQGKRGALAAQQPPVLVASSSHNELICIGPLQLPGAHCGRPGSAAAAHHPRPGHLCHCHLPHTRAVPPSGGCANHACAPLCVAGEELRGAARGCSSVVTSC